jgi:hypothetical protein
MLRTKPPPLVSPTRTTGWEVFEFGESAAHFPPVPALARPLPRFLTASLARELGILLTLSVMFPFLLHVLPVPESSRLGARLLPMFYAPLLAALWGRRQTAWLVALLAPWLNWALTRHPSPPGAVMMMIELLVFVAIVPRLLAAPAIRWLVAIPAYLTGMGVAMLAAGLVPDLINGRPPLGWLGQSLILTLPGLGVLVLITVLVLRYYPPVGKGGGPATA